jgi:hypothetical protein
MGWKWLSGIAGGPGAGGCGPAAEARGRVLGAWGCGWDTAQRKARMLDRGTGSEQGFRVRRVVVAQGRDPAEGSGPLGQGAGDDGLKPTSLGVG